MSLISWNIRGLGARPKRRALKNLINTHNPTFVFIQEIKLEELNQKTLQACWNINDLS